MEGSQGEGCGEREGSWEGGGSGKEEGEAQTAFDRPPLTEPLAFFGGHAYGDKTYTNGADRDEIVAPKFRETMFEVMGGVRELNFEHLKWGDEGIKALAVVLPLRMTS